MKRILIILILSIVAIFAFSNKSKAQLSTDYTFTNKAFLESINKERSKKKLNPLKENQELNKIARQRLDDLVKNNYFSHDSPTGNDVDILLSKSEYKHASRGENLAYGEFINEADVVDGWMGSKWHRYNILYKNFEDIGTAYAIVDYMGGHYLVVVQVFGKEKKVKTTQNPEKKINLTKTNIINKINILKTTRT